MACNCSKKNKTEFVFTSSKGTQETHPTLMSARAAQIRDGGKGSIREVERKS